MERRRDRHTVTRRECGTGILLAVALAAIPQLCAAADTALEYRVKAAFLLNFTRFVEWPATAFGDGQSPINICILGKDPFGRALDEVLQGETSNGRKLEVHRIVQPPTPRSCQVLFVDPELKELPKILAELPPGILTVSEGDHFLREGGMVSFIIDNGRVRFDIHQTASESAGLKVSAKLLAVARSVPK